MGAKMMKGLTIFLNLEKVCVTCGLICTLGKNEKEIIDLV